MKVDIFIRSCAHDLAYLDLCLKSIRKFAKGFQHVVLTVTTEERPLFKQIALDFTDLPVLLKDYPGHPNKEAGQLAAQCEACYADEYCPDTDFVLFMDSDCIFVAGVTPEDYFVNQRPVLLIEKYSRMPGVPWKQVTEEVLKTPVEYETMRRHPAVHYPKMLPMLRDYITIANGLRTDRGAGFREFVRSRKHTFPWGFTEFNIIGAYVLLSPGWRVRYHLIDVANNPYPANKLRQFWSQSPVDKPQHGMMHGENVNLVPMEICKKLGVI